MSLRITFIGSTNFHCSSAATGRRLQPPIFLGYNLRKAPTPQFFGYNQKEATTPYVLWIQPEGGYNHLSLPCLTTLKYCSTKKLGSYQNLGWLDYNFMVVDEHRRSSSHFR
jgi:hypothetical protein